MNKHEQARVLIETVKLLRAHFYTRHVRAACSNRSGAFDLTEAQLGAMLAINDQGALSLKQLAGILGVSPPSASTMVDRLVDSGMIRRKPSPRDRRSISIDLTDTGRAVVQEFESQFLRSAVDLIEKLGPEYAERWCDVYLRIQEILRAERIDETASGSAQGKAVT